MTRRLFAAALTAGLSACSNSVRQQPELSTERQALGTPTQLIAFAASAPPLNPGSYPGNTEITGPPGIWAQAGNTIYFAATDALQGAELWKTDGTAAGTALVRDIFPGTGNGLTYFPVIAPQGTHVLFIGDDGHGLETWTTDGTAAGTQVLVPGASLQPSIITPGDGGALIAGTNTLWFSDGTPAGTSFLGVLTSGSQVWFKNAFYFAGSPRPNVQTQLWKTDGTDAGTTAIANICPMFGFCRGAQMWATPNAIYLTVNSQNTSQVWISDGTGPGTSLLYDPDAGPSSIGASTAVGDTLFFLEPRASGALLSRADVDGGVRPVTTVSTLANPFQAVSYQTASGGRLFFFDDDGVHGQELWVSDGTAAGTQLVVDLWPGLDAGALWGPIPFGSGVVFTGSVDGQTSGVYVSDGTAPGTRLVASFPFELQNRAQNYFVSGSNVFFAANGNDAGLELWETDGTNTAMVKDINPEEDRLAPTKITGVGGMGLILASNTLWRSDGTVSGTTTLFQNYVGDVAALGNEALFSTSLGLWRTDGTDAGTYPISPNLFFASSFTASGGRMFFIGRPQAGNPGLYVYPSDGGVGLVRNSPGGIAFVDATPIPTGIAYIDQQENVWVSDGTDAGTQQVGSLTAFVPTAPFAEMASVGDTLFFNLFDTTTGRELWKIDLSGDAGLTLVKDVVPGFQQGSAPEQLTPAGSLLFYRATDPDAGTEVFRSDGTAAGTYALDINPGPGSSNPDRFFDVGGGRVLFAADDGSRRSYWVSDGTDAGTWALSSSAIPSLWLYRVAGGPDPEFPGGNVLPLSTGGFLFPAGDEDGDELWWSDGSPGSGMRLADLNPGAPSSNPGNLTAAGPNVFFVASDPGGPALWSLGGLPYDGGGTGPGMDGGGPGPGMDGGSGGGPGKDGGSTGGSDDAGGGPSTKGGCGCGAGGAEAWVILGALLGIAVSRRRGPPRLERPYY